MRHFLFLILLLVSSFSSHVFSQDVLEKDSYSKNNNSVFIKLKKHSVYYDHKGHIIAFEAFSDSLKTKRFEISILHVADTSKISLKNKDVLPSMDKLKHITIPTSFYIGINKEKMEIGNNNKPSLITFWSIHCGSCRHTLKTFDSLAKEFEGEVNFYAIADNSAEDVKQFLSKWNIELQKNKMIIDEKEELSNKLGIPYYPTFLIIGKDNHIEGMFFAGNIRKIVNTLESLLKSQQ